MRVEHEAPTLWSRHSASPRSIPSGTTTSKKYTHVELQGGATKRDYTASKVTGDEKAIWWDRAVETWPDHAKYQTKTDRQIPVFVLEALN